MIRKGQLVKESIQSFFLQVRHLLLSQMSYCNLMTLFNSPPRWIKQTHCYCLGILPTVIICIATKSKLFRWLTESKWANSFFPPARLNTINFLVMWTSIAIVWKLKSCFSDKSQHWTSWCWKSLSKVAPRRAFVTCLSKKRFLSIYRIIALSGGIHLTKTDCHQCSVVIGGLLSRNRPTHFVGATTSSRF